MAFEISEHCYACQKRHLKEVRKSGWEVKCNYIPKELWDNGYYPIEEIIPDEDYKKLNIIEKTKLQYKFNKLLWAKHKLGWGVFNPKRKQEQEWQKAVLLCTAKSKACRFGRRMGKTEVLCIDALHFADTTEIKNANIMIVVPYQNLLEEIFDRLKSMLNADDSCFKDSFKSTKKPFSITLANGNKILGFTAGSGSGSEGASTRGQRCDKLFLDECDYLKTGDIETVMALKMEHSNFEVMTTSTPSSNWFGPLFS